MQMTICPLTDTPKIECLDAGCFLGTAVCWPWGQNSVRGSLGSQFRPVHLLTPPTTLMPASLGPWHWCSWANGSLMLPAVCTGTGPALHWHLARMCNWGLCCHNHASGGMYMGLVPVSDLNVQILLSFEYCH